MNKIIECIKWLFSPYDLPTDVTKIAEHGLNQNDAIDQETAYALLLHAKQLEKQVKELTK